MPIGGCLLTRTHFNCVVLHAIFHGLRLVCYVGCLDKSLDRRFTSVSSPSTCMIGHRLSHPLGCLQTGAMQSILWSIFGTEITQAMG